MFFVDIGDLIMVGRCPSVSKLFCVWPIFIKGYRFIKSWYEVHLG